MVDYNTYEKEIMELGATLDDVMDDIGEDEEQLQELINFMCMEWKTMLEKTIEKFQK